MVTISWPEPQNYPVNLYSVIPGWMIYFNGRAQKPSATFLEENVAWEKFISS